MNKRKLRNVRPQAMVGADGAIMAAATLAAAGIGAIAANKAAKDQAKAIEENAQNQAEAIEKQNENNNKLQEKLIANTKSENERNRALQQQIQMNLQMLTGQQNVNEMKDAAKMQVKKGGSMKRKLRNAGYVNTFLRGSYNNLPFRVTDGGGVIPIMTTPEGYDLYEIVGNDHEHYHKAQGGKNKTGVGLRFETLGDIEGEGNQNSNQGELMLVTPDDAKFISKHTIKGYNPAQAVLAGENPIDAFNTQEMIKAMYGISDDGKRSIKPPVRKLRYSGGTSQDMQLTPDLSLDYIAPVSTAVAMEMDKNSKMRCGGRIKKGFGGDNPYDVYKNYLMGLEIKTPGYKAQTSTGFNGTLGIDYDLSKTTPSGSTTQPPADSSKSSMSGNIGGALVNAGANLGGAIITNLGNDLAAKKLSNAYTRAGNIMSDAYGSLTGIDTSLLDRNSFKNAHALAAIQAPVVNTGVERTAAKRSMDRAIKNIEEGTVSAAAEQNRIARAETNYADRIADIEDRGNKLRQDIIQNNMNRITQTSAENAKLDAQSNSNYNQILARILEYNADVKNQSILGIADAASTALQQSSSARSDAIQQGLGNLGSAISTGISGIGTAMQTDAKMQNQEEMTLLGASDDAILRYIYSTKNTDSAKRAARALWLRYRNDKSGKYKDIADNLQQEFDLV